MSHWFVYILRCADDSLYTGVTTDPDRRQREHNSRKGGARYTRARQPVSMIYRESCPDRSTALKREAQIKRMTRQQKLTLLTNVD